MAAGVVRTEGWDHAAMGGTLGELALGGVAALVRGGGARMSPADRTVDAAVKASGGVDWGQILTTVGIWAGIVGGVAAVIAIFPMSRNAALWAWRAVTMRAGIPYHRYARKFIDKYGTYENPYLRVKEKRDLRATYVPLSFQSDESQSVALATEVLTNLTADRLVIVGDPGSGKSTLLRAFGVGMLEVRFILARRTRIVPYLIPMRDLAAFLSEDKDIASFVIDKILNEHGVFKRDRAGEFFIRTLEQRQAVVMLDGLDEVPDDKQQIVLSAVIAFMENVRPECPTGRAKLLLTCRTQNFEMLRDNWLSAFGAQEAIYSLAPLRDSEITSYLLKFKGLFKNVDGPARFMRSVRDSKTLDLLRAPLILAIAVGLYADRPTMIPSTVAELYHHMIEELLDRHAFRHERRPDESVLCYRRSDKYRLLRQFALNAAGNSGNFNDFTRDSLNLFASDLAPSLEAVDNPSGIVTEIINHSGLLTPVGHGSLWHFSHRSIQEFLTAEELRLRGDGDKFLLGKAGDLNWRQAIQFYTAGQESRQVDMFIQDLAKHNCELAAHCLQAAKPSDEAARSVLDGLRPITAMRVGALAAASRSPRTSIQGMAVEEFKQFITESEDSFSGTSTTIEGMLPLLESIASTNAAEISALIPQVINALPDDPRLVGPLWQCLGASGIELRPAECASIIQRMLTLVMDPNSFAELERQDPHDRAFLTPLRSQAYPFKYALTSDHNLITLLAWAQYLGVQPPQANRFFEAKAAGRLGRVEVDQRRTLSFSLFRPARALSAVEMLAAPIAAGAVLGHNPKLLVAPLGWWTLGLIIGIGGFAFGLFVFIVWWAESRPAHSWVKSHLSSHRSWRGRGNVYIYIINRTNNPDWLIACEMIILGFCLAIAPAELFSVSLAAYVSCALGISFSFWATNFDIFDAGQRYYLYRPNDFVNVYDDPASRHWLVPGGGPGL